MNQGKKLPLLLLASLGLVLGACSDDDDDKPPQTASFEVTVYNLSANQPLTPPAVLLHQQSYSPWMLGSAASDGLEMLAEGGDTTQLVSDANMDSMVYSSATGDAVFTPGNSTTISISATASSDMRLSIASMLAFTNDAFAGASSVDVSGLASGQSKTMMLKVMDAGTEANTEASGTMPGPGGTGFEMARDDLFDAVHIHPGVVSMDDGLGTSVLNETHRWNGPVAKLTITRL